MSDQVLLPDPGLVAWYLRFAWGLVLAGMLLAAAKRWTALPRTGLALLALAGFAGSFLPGVLSPAYWLGLAFQSPSLCAAWICAHALREGLRARPAPAIEPARLLLSVLLTLLALGWLLVFDMLAWLPLQLYAQGFEPLSAGLLLVLALLPVIVQGRAAWRDPRVRVLPAALLLFVLSRWPSGNVWDAVLDPWLWLALHVYAIRQLRTSGNPHV